MSWTVRHEGSPRSIEGLNLAQVVDGLQEGLWEPTDEVRGPDDLDWQTIESHPALAEIAQDIEPPAAKVYPDETRLDMNPLIDVALVLLIFFILTTSYSILQRVIELPGGSSQKLDGKIVRTPQQLKDLVIKVEARQVNGKPVIKVENEEVEPQSLRATIARYVHERHQTNLLIDAQGVDLATVVLIQDKAKEARIERVYYPNWVTKPDAAKPPPEK